MTVGVSKLVNIQKSVCEEKQKERSGKEQEEGAEATGEVTQVERNYKSVNREERVG